MRLKSTKALWLNPRRRCRGHEPHSLQVVRRGQAAEGRCAACAARRTTPAVERLLFPWRTNCSRPDAGASSINVKAKLPTANLYSQRPQWSRQIEKSYDRIQSQRVGQREILIGSLPSSTAFSYFELAAAKLTTSGSDNQNQAYQIGRPPKPVRLAERSAIIFSAIASRR